MSVFLRDWLRGFRCILARNPVASKPLLVISARRGLHDSGARDGSHGGLYNLPDGVRFPGAPPVRAGKERRTSLRSHSDGFKSSASAAATRAFFSASVSRTVRRSPLAIPAARGGRPRGLGLAALSLHLDRQEAPAGQAAKNVRGARARATHRVLARLAGPLARVGREGHAGVDALGDDSAGVEEGQDGSDGIGLAHLHGRDDCTLTHTILIARTSARSSRARLR